MTSAPIRDSLSRRGASPRRTPHAVLASMALVSGLTLTACGGGTETATTTANESCEETHETSYMVIEGTVLNMLGRVAASQGFFGENCLEASPQNVATVPDGIKRLATNDLDFALVAPDNVFQARTEGIEVQFVANVLSRQLLSFVAATDIAEGKTFQEVLPNIDKVGVPALGGSNELMARAAISDAGGNPDDMTFVALGAPNTLLAGLKQGTADAIMAYGTAQDIASAEGYGKILQDLRKPESSTNPISPTIDAMNGSVVLYAAAEKQTRDNPEKVEAFQASIAAAAEWASDPANRDELVEIMRDDAGFPESVPDAEDAYRESIDIFADLVSAEIDADSLDAALEFTKESRNLDYTESVEESIWQRK